MATQAGDLMPKVRIDPAQRERQVADALVANTNALVQRLTGIGCVIGIDEEVFQSQVMQVAHLVHSQAQDLRKAIGERES